MEKVVQKDWKQCLDEKLPLLGHRNWILVVDQAFPLQNSQGMDYIYTNEDLLSVLSHVVKTLDSAKHVKPIIYTDQELQYVTEDMSKGIDSLRKEINNILGSHKPEVMLHEAVFGKLDESAKLFNIVVLKTNTTIPYSSVFIELDCGYWNADKEAALRKAMQVK